MASPAPDLSKSAAELTGANLACTAIGAFQGLLVIRLLGPEFYGAAAVMVALTSVGTNLIDVRLTDLISKLYFDERACHPESGHAYRAWVWRVGCALYSAGAVAIATISVGLLWVGAHRLTASPIETSWLWAAAAAQGISYLGGFFIFFQRFIMPPRRMVWVQLASALVNAAAMIVAVSVAPTVGGFVTGLAVSAAGIAALNAWQFTTVLRQQGMSLLARSTVSPSLDRRMIVKFVAAGNLLGYVKLLHRSADVLLVAAFCGDRATGLYKLARSIADTPYAASEAFSRIYQPRLLALLQARDVGEYSALVRTIVKTALVLTVLGVGLEILMLPRIAPFLGVEDGTGLTVSVAILTVPFFFVAGVQLWIWPAFVFLGRLERVTLWCGTGVIVGQYTVGPALSYITGDANPAWFSLGYLSYYAVSMLPLWRELRREFRTQTWAPREAAAL